MRQPARPPPRRSRTDSGFRPEFTLYLVYFFAFFLFFALLLVLPALLEGLRTMPPATTIEQERAAGAEIARTAIAGRLPWALLASLVALGIGGYAGALPGLRRPR